MNTRSRLLVTGVSGFLAIVMGCGGDPDSMPLPPEPGAAAGTTAAGTAAQAPPDLAATAAPKSDVEKKAILNSVIQLIQTAPTNPGGDNFTIATERLNQYFAGVDPKQFLMEGPERAYLLPTIKEQGVQDLESPTFRIRDARYIEDCLLLHTIANRIAGDGDDLTRVRRVFDWMTRQIQLVPAGTLAPPGGEQAAARPYDVLLRGMATEHGDWAERSWLFMALCRQLGVDVGLIVYPARSSGLLLREPDAAPERGVVWICAAILDGKAYLFDARIGTAVPGPGGRGVATLEEAATDPSILGRLDLPGLSPYSTNRADLARGKLKVYMDSTLGSLSPRMRELQENLVGRQRMTLFRDPSEAAAAFARVLGSRLEAAELWSLPIEVEFQLFNNPHFVTAAQHAIRLFDAKLPLLPARLGQLRGSLAEAVEKYVSFRFPDIPWAVNGQPIPRQVQDALDTYATYFLGLAKLDQKDLKGAEFFFDATLRLTPEPQRGQTLYFNMYRWGAQSNLGRLNEESGNAALAIRYYCEPKPTSQQHGDLLRARDLIWRDPFVPGATPLPQAGPAETRTAAAGP